MEQVQTYLDNLLMRLDQCKLSDSEVCRRAGIAWTTLSRVKTRKQSPTLRTMDKIVQVLDRHDAGQ